MKIKTALVDDHPFMLSGMEKGLARYEDLEIVDLSSSGEAFLKKLSKAKTLPEIAIVDFQMPKMDGFELTQKLKIRYPSIKVIMYSFNTESFIVQKALHQGAMGFISKNDPPDEMHKAIHTVYNNEVYSNKLVNKRIVTSVKKGVRVNTRFKINAEITEREKEVVLHICNGLSYKEIAQEMELSKRTIETYKERVFNKLGVAKNNDVIIYASKMGWV